MKEETINDKESRRELLYWENESEFESEAKYSEYDSEEDEDSGEKIKKTSLETKRYKQQTINTINIKYTANKKDNTNNTTNTGI